MELPNLIQNRKRKDKQGKRQAIKKVKRNSVELEFNKSLDAFLKKTAIQFSIVSQIFPNHTFAYT